MEKKVGGTAFSRNQVQVLVLGKPIEIGLLELVEEEFFDCPAAIGQDDLHVVRGIGVVAAQLCQFLGRQLLAFFFLGLDLLFLLLFAPRSRFLAAILVNFLGHHNLGGEINALANSGLNGGGRD